MSSRTFPPESQKRYLEAKNVGSQTIPAYGACEIAGIENVRDTLVVYQVKRPTAYDLRAVAFNSQSPIAAGSYGKVSMDWPVFCTTDSTPSVGDVLGTQTDSFNLTVNSSGWRVLGDLDGVSRVTYDGSPRLWRGTLNEDLSSGEADGDLLLLDGTDTGRDVTFLAAIIFDNPAVTNTTEIYAIEQDGNFYIVNSECPV